MPRLRSFIERTTERGTERVPCYSCAHCNKIVIVETPDQPTGFCMLCFYPTCLKCGGSEKCEPFEKKLLAMEARGKLLASAGL